MLLLRIGVRPVVQAVLCFLLPRRITPTDP